MKFEWDSEKSEANNIRERGLDFIDAIPTFDVSDRKIWEDIRLDYDEKRFNMLSKHNGRIFFVTFTLRNHVVRIISFRKANQREVINYDQL